MLHIAARRCHFAEAVDAAIDALLMLLPMPLSIRYEIFTLPPCRCFAASRHATSLRYADVISMPLFA